MINNKVKFQFSILCWHNIVLMLLFGLSTKNTMSLAKKLICSPLTRHEMCWPLVIDITFLFHTYKCWNTVLSSGHLLGSLLACNSTTIPLDLQSWQSGNKYVTWTWCDTLYRNINTSHGLMTHTNVSVVCRDADCQHFILVTGPDTSALCKRSHGRKFWELTYSYPCAVFYVF